jgi:hypothetical protein
VPKADHCFPDGRHKGSLARSQEPDGVTVAVDGETVVLAVAGGRVALSEAEVRGVVLELTAAWSRLGVIG